MISLAAEEMSLPWLASEMSPSKSCAPALGSFSVRAKASVKADTILNGIFVPGDLRNLRTSQKAVQPRQELWKSLCRFLCMLSVSLPRVVASLTSGRHHSSSNHSDCVPRRRPLLGSHAPPGCPSCCLAVDGGTDAAYTVVDWEARRRKRMIEDIVDSGRLVRWPSWGVARRTCMETCLVPTAGPLSRNQDGIIQSRHSAAASL